MDDTLADPLAGRLLDGRYAVTARLAHGGMATVYLGLDTRLDREVALKVMHADLARDEDFVRRFIGEARSVARLSHQNVVAVFDQGSDGPFLYLVMEYVPGRTLKEVLRWHGPFAPPEALEVMTGVLAGLAAAHASGIVHRDVKPENVLLTGDGRVKVADFGLARAHWAAGHTRSGLLIGTVGYVPPEQVTGEATGPVSDVYSAGVMLFELLTGRLPFTGDSPLSVAYQHVNSGVPAPSSLQPGISAAVDQLVLTAASRDPAGRPADAGEFLREVRRVRESELACLPGLQRADVEGDGLRGLAEAPWLDLDPAAATDGWRSRTGVLPLAGLPGPDPAAGADGLSRTLVVHRRNDDGPAGGPGSGGAYPGAPYPGAPYPGGTYPGGPDASGPYASDPDASDPYASDPYANDPYANDPYASRREPFLQRWLFSPRLLIVAAVVALGIALGLGGWWLAAGRYAAVPSVAGDTAAQAAAALRAGGFTVRRDERVHSNTVPEGTVVGTSPSGRTGRGAAITVLVSAGPFTSTVPRVQGDTVAAARAALASAHLTATTEKVGSNAKIGTVVGSTPAAGTSWPQTKPVTLLVANGPPLPDFVGETVQAAQQWAQQHGVTLQQRSVGDSQDAAGVVTGQQPAAGSTVQPGETVTVSVSTGPQEVAVPDPIGMTVSQATRLLESAGFKVQVDNFGLFGHGNRVFDFSPVGQAPRGSTVTLDVGGF